MKTIVLNTQEASNKAWAFRDAARRNDENASRHTQKNKIRAERMMYALELLYSCKDIYISYGKKSISVKLNAAHVRDKKNLVAIENEWDTSGVVKKVTPQGVIYNFSV
jgi:hypothetical protein